MKGSGNYEFNKLLMDLGRGLLLPLTLFYRVKRYYVPGECSGEELAGLGGALIAANHTGFSDPFILNAVFWKRRFFYTASEEVMAGFKGKLLKAAGCIRIDRTTADIAAIKSCANVLKDGYLLGIFPQGHIGSDPARGGAVLIAAMGAAPIVPVYIEKRKRFWQRHKVVFGKPIDVRDYCSRRLPGKNETEEVLRVWDERTEMCREYLKSLKILRA